jgi:hypothetical protein
MASACNYLLTTLRRLLVLINMAIRNRWDNYDFNLSNHGMKCLYTSEVVVCTDVNLLYICMAAECDVSNISVL